MACDELSGLLHAIAVLATTVWFYSSHDPERDMGRAIICVFLSYPSSLLLTFLRRLPDAALAPAFLVIGTLQWGVVGVIVDTIIHRVRGAAAPNI